MNQVNKDNFKAKHKLVNLTYGTKVTFFEQENMSKEDNDINEVKQIKSDTSCIQNKRKSDESNVASN